MAERKKNNFRIHLSGKKYIVGDGYSFWIVSESTRKNKSGESTVYQKKLSGYHDNLTSLMNSYFNETLKKSEIDGELKDLAKLIVKTRNEIYRWWNATKGAMEEETRKVVEEMMEEMKKGKKK